MALAVVRLRSGLCCEPPADRSESWQVLCCRVHAAEAERHWYICQVAEAADVHEVLELPQGCRPWFACRNVRLQCRLAGAPPTLCCNKTRTT